METEEKTTTGTPTPGASGANEQSAVAAHDRVVAKHAPAAGTAPAPAKRPVGRPRNAAATPKTVPPPAAPGGAVAPAPQWTVDPAVIRRSVESVVKVVDQFVTKRVFKAAFAVSQNKDFSVNLADDVAMSEDQRELIGSLTTTIMEKYKMLGQYAPEALLAVAVADYGIRVTMTLRKLDEIKAIRPPTAAPAHAVALTPPDESSEPKKTA